MRFSIALTTVAVSSLAFLSSRVSAGLSEAEKAAHLLKNPGVNYCDVCITKAMHNHFPHACPDNLNNMEANTRPTGATDTEERCLCISFQDLSWMKADCSAECPFTHNAKTMRFFLPASKIEGCDKWIDFETNEERIVDGFEPKRADHVPEVFEIAPAPEGEADDDYDDTIDDEGHFKTSFKFTFDEETIAAAKKFKEEGNLLADVDNKKDVDDSKAEPETNNDSKANTESKKDERDEL
ncbi:hypothetical protein BGZ46_007142 [Entomortierella lignicola]|nr:hypothetical protein BGZ46_007142 [Entomortierella lignicola]